MSRIDRQKRKTPEEEEAAPDGETESAVATTNYEQKSRHTNQSTTAADSESFLADDDVRAISFMMGNNPDVV